MENTVLRLTWQSAKPAEPRSLREQAGEYDASSNQSPLVLAGKRPAAQAALTDSTELASILVPTGWPDAAHIGLSPGHTRNEACLPALNSWSPDARKGAKK